MLAIASGVTGSSNNSTPIGMMPTHQDINASTNMRTTLDLDPAALEAARQLAAHRTQSLGRVISELILDGLRARSESARSLALKNGFPVVPAEPGQRPVSSEDVKHLLEDEPS